MTVEVLYFAGCPNHEPAVERVKKVLRAEGMADEVKEVEVRDDIAAQQLRFPGSPTIRVRGVDIEPSTSAIGSFGLVCRTYWDGRRPSGVPPVELIRQAIRGEKQ